MARAIEADMVTACLSTHVWHQTFILFVAIVLRNCTSGPHASAMRLAYDLECGPLAARAVEIITASHHFAQDLADAMGVCNRDSLPPAALMAEWAVRCVYSDSDDVQADDISHDFALQPVLENDAGGACEFVADTLGIRSVRNATRFVHAAHVYVTQGRRVGNGLWPEVHVMYARCSHANAMMQAAARPVENEMDTDVTHRHAWGKALLAQARFVLPPCRHGAAL